MRGRMRITGSGDIKNIHSVGIRSIPKIQRSSYLELFGLKKEKDRLGKEIFALDKRKHSVDRQLSSINRRIEILQKETLEEQQVNTGKRQASVPFMTMEINY
jgi:hypothetical protein